MINLTKFKDPAVSSNNNIKDLVSDEIHSVGGGLVFNNLPLGFIVILDNRVRFDGGDQLNRNTDPQNLFQVLQSEDSFGFPIS